MRQKMGLHLQGPPWQAKRCQVGLPRGHGEAVSFPLTELKSVVLGAMDLNRIPLHTFLSHAFLLLLILYLILDFSSHPSFFSSLFKDSDHQNQNLICTSIHGHLGTPYSQTKAWSMMKFIGQPASCPVNGLLIERLDPENNFRRGFALKFTTDVEDKTHLLPWLLGSKIDLNRRPRRVYLDLGGNKLDTSILWFMRMYPCDFTEIHAFEANHELLQKPAHGFDEDSNGAESNPWALKVKKTPYFPQWMLDRIQIYYKYVGDKDDEQSSSINITRFIKEELKLKASDSVVVKMDIEGSEWPILKRWIADPDMSAIVDELFVEVHYDHPSMHGYGWAKFAPVTRDDALTLLADLRLHGFYVHPWP